MSERVCFVFLIRWWKLKRTLKNLMDLLLKRYVIDHMWLALCPNHRQGLYKSWKTWKVMEFMISISRPGKTWNSSKGHGKSWKSNLLLDNKMAKR